MFNISEKTDNLRMYCINQQYQSVHKVATKDLTTFQLKAARRALDVSLRDVSDETGIGINALLKLESGDPSSVPKNSQFKTISRLRLYLESKGIEFLENGYIRYVPRPKEAEIVFRIKE